MPAFFGILECCVAALMAAIAGFFTFHGDQPWPFRRHRKSSREKNNG